MKKKIENSLTIDVEDYFQVTNFASFVDPESWDTFPSRVNQNTSNLLLLFEQYKIRVTFFILGWVAERNLDLVKRIHNQGHEVACHGYGHQLVYELGEKKFRDDIRRAKHILEDACGEAVIGYRAPSYSIIDSSKWALDVLISEGFRYDSSIFPTHHPRYGIPDAPRHHHVIKREQGTIEEFPPSTIPVGKWNFPIAGGGYFRLFPYFLTRWGGRRLNSRGEDFVFYLHPWEIDPGQPRFKEASRLSRFRHYVNLGRTRTKLVRLMQDFQFAPLKDYLFNREQISAVS